MWRWDCVGIAAAVLLAFLTSAAAEGTLGNQEPVLWLDASDPATAAVLSAGVGTRADSVWQDLSGNQNDLQLHNAGYDPNFGGSVTFTAPAAGSQEQGTYGMRNSIQGVRAGAWGEALTAVIWYRGESSAVSPGASLSPTLLQVLGLRGAAGVEEDLTYSASWQVNQFLEQDASGMQKFTSSATYGGVLPACWQQLAVVKNGTRLQFYRDLVPSGFGSTARKVKDYGAAGLALGVNYPALNSTSAVSGSAAVQEPLNWLSGSLGVVMLFDSALSVGELADLYDQDAHRFEDLLCTANASALAPAPAAALEPHGSLSPSPLLESPAPAPSSSSMFPTALPSPPSSSPAPAPAALEKAPAPAPASSVVGSSPTLGPSAAQPSPVAAPSPAQRSPSPTSFSPSPAAPLSAASYVDFSYAVESSDLGAYTPEVESAYQAALAQAVNVPPEQFALTSTFIINVTLSGPAPMNASLVFGDYLDVDPSQVEVVEIAPRTTQPRSHTVTVSVASGDEAGRVLAAFQGRAGLALVLGADDAEVLASKELLLTSAEAALSETQLSGGRLAQFVGALKASSLEALLISVGMPRDTTLTMIQAPLVREPSQSLPSPAPTPSPTVMPSPPPATPRPSPALSPSSTAGSPPSLAPTPSPSPLPSPSPRPSIPPAITPPPSPSTAVPSSPTPSTLDKPTAVVQGPPSAPTGVSNHLSITGKAEDLLPFDDAKQQQLKEAIVASLNLDPSYDASNVEIRVVTINGKPPAGGSARRLLQEVTVDANTTVVVEYVLKPTPEVPAEALVTADVDVKLFIRVQADQMPWWQGSLCQSDTTGSCTSQPISPPVVIDGCTSDICFALDDSGSVAKVDAWNDITAAARSIMYSVSGRQSVFAVYRFSNFVEAMGTPATRAQIGADNSLIKLILNSPPRARGTYTADAIQQCQAWLSSLTTGHPKTVLLLTDGQPTDKPEALAAAAAAKAAGIRIVAVGAGDVDFETLSTMSSGPDAVFASSELDTAQLLKLADSAAQGVCAEE